MSHAVTPPTLEEDTEILDPDWLAAPSRRSRTRLVLLGALAVLLVFFAGVQVQKHWGSDSGSSGSAAPSGFPASGDLGALPAGGRSGSGPSSTSGGSTSATPAVIGTVSAVHGHTWTVKDLGGHSHTVKVTGSTTLTRPMADSSTPVRAGTHVTVQGKTRGHTVTATAITLR